MTNQPHIHTSTDKRGKRDVFLNGKRIESVLYANTKKGVVRVARTERGLLKLHKHGKRIQMRTLHGAVQVLPLSRLSNRHSSVTTPPTPTP